MKYILILFFLLSVYQGYAQVNPQPNTPPEQVNPYAEKPLLVNQFLYFDSELIEFDFNAFESNFHKKNIDLLEKPKLLWGVEYGVQYKTLFFGINMNFGAQSGSVSDTVDTKTNYTRFGLSTGYYLIDTRHIQLVPKVSIYANSLSLRNFNAKDDIDLDEYTSNPDFKLSFRQYTAQFGLDINFKIHKISTKPGQPFLVGITYGYNLDLGNTKVKSAENTLNTSSNISSVQLTFALHFTMLL